MMPDCRHSTVFLPITRLGRAGSTLSSCAARRDSASTEISMPGANAPPTNSPFALTASKLVEVPKSTMIAGPPYRCTAANAFMIRALPEQALQHDGDFVGGPDRIGRDPPVLDHLVRLEDPEHGLGVPDVDGQQHDRPGGV